MDAVQAAAASWIARAGRCGYDHTGELPHRLYASEPGRGGLGGLAEVWEDGEGLAALAIHLRFGEAFDVFVAPRHRCSDIERAMIERAAGVTAHLAAAGHEYVLTDAFDCDAARIESLERLSFERFRVWDDVNALPLGGTVPRIETPAGFTVRVATAADASGVSTAHADAFGEAWTAKAYREAWTKPGFGAAREFVAVSDDGRIAAFAVAWLDERNRLGHLEPVGTHADFRRRGLARAVLAAALGWLHDRGMALASVNHNAENEAARRLYGSLGFAKTNETYGFRRRIDRHR